MKAPLSAVAVLAVAVLPVPAQAGVIVYRNSAQFLAATDSYSIQLLENFSADVNNGDLISSGDLLHGIAYSNSVGFLCATIANQYTSFSGQSPAVNYTVNALDQTFFYVNAGSRSYHVAAFAATASPDCATFDTRTFIFAGMVLDVPFRTATLSGASSFNVVEILGAGRPSHRDLLSRNPEYSFLPDWVWWHSAHSGFAPDRKFAKNRQATSNKSQARH
jgi:hypothetical protein